MTISASAPSVVIVNIVEMALGIEIVIGSVEAEVETASVTAMETST